MTIFNAVHKAIDYSELLLIYYTILTTSQQEIA